MLKDREKILSALREKPLKIFEVMKRANLPNQEACQALLLKMRDEGSGEVRHPQGRLDHRMIRQPSLRRRGRQADPACLA